MKRQIREIKISDLFLYFWLSLIILTIIWVGYAIITLTGIISISKIIPLSVSIVFSYLPVRRLIIGIVLLYKAYAPMEVREKCRFEPTCSTYMIMAINKYGIIVGLTKGIKRLLRCKPPNGGVDYP